MSAPALTGLPLWRHRLLYYAVAANVRLSRYTRGLPQLLAANPPHPSRDDFSVAVVVVSRNDDYGGRLLERAGYALRSAMATFDKVLYVDWASPREDLLHDLRHDLPASGRLSMIRVSPDLAAHLVRHDPEAQACCEVLGRNIGIRRLADQGFDYIVSSNIDIVFPGADGVRDFVRQRLAPHRMMTIARREVTLDDLGRIGWKDPIAVSQQLRADIGSYRRQPRYDFDAFSLVKGCGDFQIAPRRLWEVIRGFEERMIYSQFADTGVQAKALAAGFEVTADFELPIFHIAHAGGGGGGGRRNRRWSMVPPLGVTANPPTWGFVDHPGLCEMAVTSGAR